jgi:nucleotide-binding universal stress UspA family protein
MAAVSAAAVSADWPESDEAPVTDEMRASAVSYLNYVQRRLQERGLTVDYECEEGSASEVILRRARQLGVDFIAMTTHGRSGVDRVVFGSVADEVLHWAPCPVFMVRAQEGH